MKLKKTLSGILAAAMVVTMIPSMAFATTTNTVSAVPTVAADEEMPATTIAFEVKDPVAWSGDQTIKLTFDNAKWNKEPSVGTTAIKPDGKIIYATGTNGTPTNPAKAKYTIKINAGILATSVAGIAKTATSAGAYANITETTTAALTATQTALELTNVINAASNRLYNATVSDDTITLTARDAAAWDDPTAIDMNATVEKITTGTAGSGDGLKIAGDISGVKFKSVVASSEDSLEVTFNADGAINTTGNKIIYITFDKGVLKSKDTDGPVTIAIDGLDSKVSSSTLTVANVGSSNTIATVTGKVKTIGRESKALEGKVEIRETAVNTITGAQVLKLTLPKGITWTTGTKIEGTLFNATMTTAVDSADAVDAAGKYYLANSGRSVYLYAALGVVSDSARDVATLTPAVSVGKTAVEGDITIDLTAYKAIAGSSVSDASDLVVAKYGSEGVKVLTCDDENIPTIVAGYELTKKNKVNYIQVTLKESVAKSLTSGKKIDFDLPEEVQIVSGQAIRAYIGNDAKIGDAKDYDSIEAALNFELDDDKDRSDFSITVPKHDEIVYGTKKWSETASQTLNLFIPVTVKADYIGDVEVTVKGNTAGVAETTLLVAKTISPITVETSSTDVKNGVQKQATADITITENEAGYIKDGKNIVISLDDIFGTGLMFAKNDVKAEVTSGDLNIDSTTVANGTVTIKVKDSSTKASTIAITGLYASLSRVLPEGPYDLTVGGSALIDNATYNDGKFGSAKNDVHAATVEKYINIITPAESVTVSEKVDAKFVIGEAAYTNNGEATTMDAAAYIDSNNRTMVPIRYVANACGISEEDITWNQATQTATINGLNTVVSIKMGSNVIQTSNGDITMDTVAVNKDGRIYVPVRFIANALGANVSWDAATKTVTLTK